MRYKYLLLSLSTAVLFSCKKEKGAVVPPSQSTVDPVPAVLLKEIVIAALPSPYYHFEYDTVGKISFVSFASGLNRYNVIYNGNRIDELKNNIVVNKDRIEYFYGTDETVDVVRYVDSMGLVFVGINFTYDGSKLIELERKVKSSGGFITDKTMTMSFYPDGNLKELVDHRFPVNGQTETTSIDRFEQYDNKINVDAFDLIHNDFFDHLVLLPGVQLQKNNPAKVIRTGDGINYKIDYTYTYNDKGAPVARSGDFTYTSGINQGQHIPLSSVYTYY